jgi:Caudovirus prohead serine protease
MSKILGPRGWTDGQIVTRFVNTAPSSYDATNHTVDAVISAGARVSRYYGTEILRIDSQSVNLDRVRRGVAPLLDSHQGSSINTALGRIAHAWIEGGRLMGRLSFNDTEAGRSAEGMIRRSEIVGCSAGYRVEQWEISDEDGNIVDPDRASFDDDLVFTATRWELLECSLVSCPADSSASIRNSGSDADDLDAVRARMKARQAISDRNSARSDNLR